MPLNVTLGNDSQQPKNLKLDTISNAKSFDSTQFMNLFQNREMFISVMITIYGSTESQQLQKLMLDSLRERRRYSFSLQSKRIGFFCASFLVKYMQFLLYSTQKLFLSSSLNPVQISAMVLKAQSFDFSSLSVDSPKTALFLSKRQTFRASANSTALNLVPQTTVTLLTRHSQTLSILFLLVTSSIMGVSFFYGDLVLRRLLKSSALSSELRSISIASEQFRFTVEDRSVFTSPPWGSRDFLAVRARVSGWWVRPSWLSRSFLRPAWWTMMGVTGVRWL